MPRFQHRTFGSFIRVAGLISSANSQPVFPMRSILIDSQQNEFNVIQTQFDLGAVSVSVLACNWYC